MDSAINGVLQSLDPYSAYMSPELFKSMQTESKGEFGGLGIEIAMEGGVVKVIAPIADTPAEKVGIKAGDYIVKINEIQVQGKSLMEAVKLMRGPVGSSINLTIRRKGVKKSLSFEVKREIIEVKSVESKILGKKNWEIPFGEYKNLTEKGIPITGTYNFGGVTGTDGGLLVATGTQDNKVRAFDSSNVNELWSYQLPFSGSTPPTIFEHLGEQYVIIPATGGLVLSFAYPELVEQGDTFLAFKLKK